VKLRCGRLASRPGASLGWYHAAMPGCRQAAAHQAREVVKLSKSAFGNAILPLLFPKERVPASYPPTPR
jgi:hypothetical protein